MIQKKGAASQHRGGDFHLLDATPRKSKKNQGIEVTMGPRRTHDQGSKERPSGATAPARILASKSVNPKLLQKH